MLLVVAIAFMLGACGVKEETRTFEYDEASIVATMTFYYTGDKVTKQTTENIIQYESVGISSKDGGVLITMTYYYEDDTVTKQTTKNVLPYESIGISTKEEAKEILDPLSAELQGVEGLTQKIEYGDTEATETLKVDYEKLNFDEANGLLGMMVEGDSDGKVSMEKSADMLLDQGFVEK